MNDLFNALLDISKLESGGMIPNLSEFPIAQLLKRVELTFEDAAHEKNLSWKVVASKAWVRSDVIMLERILFNLVSNAVRYTSLGGVRVGCRMRGKQLRIEIWDTGPGIAEDQREKVFTEFYRGADPRRDPRGGLGLGLAIVDRLCQLLELPIELTSVVGKGSRFTVVVPLALSQMQGG